MPDHLRGLVEAIVRSLPIKDPHAQKRQQQQIVDLCTVNHMKLLRPVDHIGPQPIIKVQVWEDVIPPVMVCSRLVLPLLVDPMEGVLGDL